MLQVTEEPNNPNADTGGDGSSPNVMRALVEGVLAAHDEAAGIEARLQNLLSLDYPAERLEILLGLDGCSDATAEREVFSLVDDTHPANAELGQDFVVRKSLANQTCWVGRHGQMVCAPREASQCAACVGCPR